MIKPKRIISLSRIVPGVFFIACFLFFAIFNRYLMAYQEQTQFFRFDWNYFFGFLSRPGGLAAYTGTFLIQFYINPLAGAFIVTMSGLVAYSLSGYIFKKYQISGMIWSLIPALLIISLQCDYMFSIGYIIGLLLALTSISIYISVRDDLFRYATGFISFSLLYLFAGGFSFLAVLICIIHEIFFAKNRFRFFVAAGLAFIALFLPYLTCKTIYYIPVREAWGEQNFLILRKITKYTLLLFIAYFPLLLMVIKIFQGDSKKTWLQSGWNLKNIFAGVIVVLAFSGVFKKYVFKPNLNLFFEIDANVQQGKWDKVLRLTSLSRVQNRLILYYTNLALYKTGHLGDRMFYFNQIGVQGLWLNREGDENSLFLGGELFYHLGNFNEANRWAYDAMVANGQTPPRLLRQLIKTSLINRDFVVADKYIEILDHGLFYRNWAAHYRRCLNDSALTINDPEIAEKQNLLIHSDFVATLNDSDIGLKQLLENHPDNRMAFEYYMASLLLDKNLEAFADNIHRIKDFGYKELPVHFEEALLIYMGYIGKNVLPAGYGIRKVTVLRFKEYSKAYSSRTGTPENEAKSFYKSFGNTYWFYLHFINNRASSNEENHPFN
jgi:hypothetical protein